MWAEAARSGGAGIVGGDLVRSPQWVVSVTVLGELDGRPAVTRGGANAGTAPLPSPVTSGGPRPGMRC